MNTEFRLKLNSRRLTQFGPRVPNRGLIARVVTEAACDARGLRYLTSRWCDLRRIDFNNHFGLAA